MIIKLKKNKLIVLILVLILSITSIIFLASYANAQGEQESASTYIKWAELNVTQEALQDTMELDIQTYDMLRHISWIDSLAYLACKNGNDFSSYKSAQLDALVLELGEIYTVDDLMQESEFYEYYKQIFTAMLGGMLSEFEREIPDGNGGITTTSGYGLVAYSPIAEGFYYSHYDDFGNSRSYGYDRNHLGNDLLGSIGTPIIAVEGGVVESIGWNQYGGWRIGIRSFDGLRSYYYAHLRQDSPYRAGLELGSVVKAGDVIGYMGMTGYSTTENVNGMSVCHLHFGMQLIFDESQKEGVNQIWVDVYELVKFLYQNRATVIKDSDSGEYYRMYDIIDYNYPIELQNFD
ncbi:MAG: M23 family metallopeptidase [Clostridia bacterium]